GPDRRTGPPCPPGPRAPELPGAGTLASNEPAAAELWAGGGQAEATGPGREVRCCGHNRERRLFQPGVQRVRLRRRPEPGRRALPLPLVRTSNPCRRERGRAHRTATFVVYRVRSAGHEQESFRRWYATSWSDIPGRNRGDPGPRGGPPIRGGPIHTSRIGALR